MNVLFHLHLHLFSSSSLLYYITTISRSPTLPRTSLARDPSHPQLRLLHFFPSFSSSSLLPFLIALGLGPPLFLCKSHLSLAHHGQWRGVPNGPDATLSRYVLLVLFSLLLRVSLSLAAVECDRSGGRMTPVAHGRWSSREHLQIPSPPTCRSIPYTSCSWLTSPRWAFPSSGTPVRSIAEQPSTPTKGAFGTEFFKLFGGPKKTTRGKRSATYRSVPSTTDRSVDGQPPKRRGPKPDSKPALTRRQELNRQAQR